MKATLKTVLEAALALSPEDRRQLVETLNGSLAEVPAAHDTPEFREELRRRFEEYKAGRMELVPWEVVKKRAREFAKKKQAARRRNNGRR